MKLLLVWLAVCTLLLGGVAGAICWATDQSVLVLVQNSLDKNFVLGMICALIVIVAFLVSVLSVSKP